MKKYRCTVCGYILEGELTADYTCPICMVPADKFELIEEGKKDSKYSGTQTEKNLQDAFAGETKLEISTHIGQKLLQMKDMIKLLNCF